MKKLISGLMLFVFALTLTSCIDMNSQTTLSFKVLPDAVITQSETGKLNPKDIVVLIDGKAYALDAAEKIGAIVEGDEYDLGYNTLLVTYNNVTISFTYLVEAPLPEVYDISWYDNSTVEGKEYVLMDAADLRGLAHLVNAKNVTFAGQTVKLGADIDLAGYVWTPIGEGARKVQAFDEDGNPVYEKGELKYNTNLATTHTFQGTFDGQNFVISNLSDAGYVAIEGEKYTNSEDEHTKSIFGYAYGLFAVINADGVVIKNVTLENVQISGASVSGGQAYVADSVGGILGWSGAGNIEIHNCKVSGEIAGYDAVAGIAGRLYSGTYTIDKCSNDANIDCLRESGGKAAGIIGFTSSPKVMKVSLCENKGEITGGAESKGQIYVRQNVERDGKTSEFHYNGVEMMLYTKLLDDTITMPIPGSTQPHTNDEHDLPKAK